jgi:hypothetical protein
MPCGGNRGGEGDVIAGVYAPEGLVLGLGTIGSSSKKPEADLFAPLEVAGLGGRVATLGD